MKANKHSRTGGSGKAALQCRTLPPQRILIVENEPDIRRLDTEVLSESGYRIDSADNGLDALHSLDTHNYDLLIIEDEMSPGTGLEFVKKLRSEDLMVPVILVLGTIPVAEPNGKPWPQVQAILLKPYTVAELFKTVKEVLCAAGSGPDFRFAPPANWQSPVCSRLVSALTS